jgi:hypothetical protein
MIRESQDYLHHGPVVAELQTIGLTSNLMSSHGRETDEGSTQ